tara:strand:- start:748 stop:1023 length:276 start_codon:yes stop_codon:yes gene_type:complete
MFKVVAINVSGRPNDIPTSKWIEKDEVYTVLKMDHMSIQGGALGFKLEEINIDDCFPYQYFSAERFRPFSEEDAEAEEAVRKLLEEQCELV